MIIIGIDPGLAGGIAAGRTERGSIIEVEPLPIVRYESSSWYDEPALRTLLLAWKREAKHAGSRCHVFIEKAQPLQRFRRKGESGGGAESGAEAGHGSIASFKLGSGFGMFRGLCAGLAINYTLVPPRRWQKEFFAGLQRGPGMTKIHSVNEARRIFPGVSLLASPRCTTPHNGMSDALLIMEYGRRQMQATEEEKARDFIPNIRGDA